MNEGQVLPSEDMLEYIADIPLDQIQVNCGLRMPSGAQRVRQMVSKRKAWMKMVTSDSRRDEEQKLALL